KIAPKVVVGGEWGVGSGETTCYSPLPTPHSPLPSYFLVQRQLGKLFIVVFQSLSFDVGDARHRDRAGANDVKNADGFEQFDKGVDLFGVASQLDYESVVRHVNDPGAEDLDQAQDLLPLDALMRVDGQHDHLAFDVRAGGHISDLDHSDHLAGLLKYLLYDM